MAPRIAARAAQKAAQGMIAARTKNRIANAPVAATGIGIRRIRLLRDAFDVTELRVRKASQLRCAC